MNDVYDKARLSEELNSFLYENYGVLLQDSTKKQLYNALCFVVRSILKNKYHTFIGEASKQESKRICYLSMEFLIGKTLRNNLFNLGLDSIAEQIIIDCSYDIDDIYMLERDPSLGNGGLGRLAAAYMDALASSDYRGEGYSILYEYGFFKQYFSEYEQRELPDEWLDSGRYNISRADDKSIIVKIGGSIDDSQGDNKYVDYKELIALPYDIYVSGYCSHGVSRLRLWKCVSNSNFDMNSLLDGCYDDIISKRGEASLVSMFLYPPDNTERGKTLRLIQQYFFVSATVQEVIAEHYKKYRCVTNLSEKIVFHINDTHPAICIPEIIRVLCECYSLDFETALKITKKCVSYTNHTVLPEAFESWESDIFMTYLPRIYEIVTEINQRQSLDLCKCTSNEWGNIGKLAIISDGYVRMANMSLYCSYKINGVSQLHTEILKNDLFSSFYSYAPNKFENVTNGITYRRWLCQANVELTKVIDECIGDGYKKYPQELLNLTKYKTDKQLLEKIRDARYKNKVRLSEISKKLIGISLDPASMYDVQIKRLHEYKRQLLNVMKIICYFLELKQNPHLDIMPKTFIFAAKSAPSYYHAKRIIKLINKLSELINADPVAREKINVVFLPDYNVWLAENIIPSADVSEQISLAGKEASGTGNMKLMLNGALTIGTYDGANVEISQLVGEENIYIFGMRAQEVYEIVDRRELIGDSIRKNERLAQVISFLEHDIQGEDFSDIAHYLCNAENPDPYLCTVDFESYINTFRQVSSDYRDPRKYFSKALSNIAMSGYFAADRAIFEYADRIWNLNRVFY